MELLDSPCVGERPRPLFFGSADLLFSFSIFLRGWSSSVAGATDGVFATTSAWSGSVAGDAESSSWHDTGPSVFSMSYLYPGCERGWSDTVGGILPEWAGESLRKRGRLPAIRVIRKRRRSGPRTHPVGCDS